MKHSGKYYQMSYMQMLATLQETVCKKYQETVVMVSDVIVIAV